MSARKTASSIAKSRASAAAAEHGELAARRSWTVARLSGSWCFGVASPCEHFVEAGLRHASHEGGERHHAECPGDVRPINGEASLEDGAVEFGGRQTVDRVFRRGAGAGGQRLQRNAAVEQP